MSWEKREIKRRKDNDQTIKIRNTEDIMIYR